MGLVRDIINNARLKQQVIKTELEARKLKAATLNLNSSRLWDILRENKVNQEEELVRPWQQVPVVKAAIRAKAGNIAHVPFRLYPTGSEEPIETGPIVDLFDDVNPHMSKYDLWFFTVACLDLWGDCPTWMDEERGRGGVPAYLWPRRPDTVQARFVRDAFAGWEMWWGKTSKIVPADEVLLPKYVNLYDELRGDPLSEVLTLTLKAEWGAIRFNQVFFDNDGTPGSVFTTDQNLEDAQFDRLEKQLVKKRAGVNNAHKGLLLDGGMKVSSTRMSNRDMQFLDLRRFTREDVAMVFKVPKTELTLYEDVNYATAQSEDVGFWKKTLLPLMQLIEDEYNRGLLRPLGYEGRFDIKAIDVLNSEILQKAETAKTFWDMGVPFAAINDRLNLEFDEVEGAELPWGGRATVGAAAELPDPGYAKMPRLVGDERPPEIDGLREKRLKMWDDLVLKVRPSEGRANAAIRSYFSRVEQRVLRKLVKSHEGQSVLKATAEDGYEWLDDMLSDAEFAALMADFLEGAYKTGGETISTAFDEPDPNALAALARRASKIGRVNETVSRQLKDTIRETIRRGIAEGWTEEERAQAVVEVVRGKLAQARRRARTIARTETHGAFNEGRYNEMSRVGIKRHRWITARDVGTHSEPVRKTHRVLDGMVIDVGEKFPNGLRYPLDQNGVASEVINCRCVCVPVAEDEL